MELSSQKTVKGVEDLWSWIMVKVKYYSGQSFIQVEKISSNDKERSGGPFPFDFTVSPTTIGGRQ